MELYRNDQHRFKIVVDSENEVELMVQTRHMRDLIVLVIRGLAQRFNSTSLNSLLKIETWNKPNTVSQQLGGKDTRRRLRRVFKSSTLKILTLNLSGCESLERVWFVCLCSRDWNCVSWQNTSHPLRSQISWFCMLTDTPCLLPPLGAGGY